MSIVTKKEEIPKESEEVRGKYTIFNAGISKGGVAKSEYLNLLLNEAAGIIIEKGADQNEF